MNTRTVEIGVGVFVALGFAALLMLAMRVSNLAESGGGHGYSVVAHFDNVGGLKVRSPVTIAGVRVGRVSDIRYDSEHYVAAVTMSIEPQFDRIPADSSASVLTAGLLGEQYIGLEPGGDETSLKDGDEIKFTQSALVLEQVVGQFLFSKASEGSK
ncbi:MAG: outer membrane lipid asymmetry maintenance protein MlaD [Ectothiorhodospiraceae bacterium]|nr:outer membrane lipid asymmetry maintenance protein MlaD [Ectothiorhodospiraceae bacterium]